MLRPKIDSNFKKYVSKYREFKAAGYHGRILIMNIPNKKWIAFGQDALKLAYLCGFFTFQESDGIKLVSFVMFDSESAESVFRMLLSNGEQLAICHYTSTEEGDAINQSDAGESSFGLPDPCSNEDI